jgi:putative addiction module killer protein
VPNKKSAYGDIRNLKGRRRKKIRSSVYTAYGKAQFSQQTFRNRRVARRLFKRLDETYPSGYNLDMEYVVRQTGVFAQWRADISDPVAKTAIRRRIRRMEMGNLGDVKPVGEGVSEARVDVGVGYRLYFAVRKRTVVFLLCGGDKSTQTADIRIAKAMAKEI